jgi:hypothetical protein
VSRLAVRWTVGDVSDEGLAALRLSIWGAWRAFGSAAEFAVCVNSRPLSDVREAIGTLPIEVAWHAVDRSALPGWLTRRLDGGMAEGVGWKFAPPRLFDGYWVLALDNDCILWERPRAIARWLEADDAAVLAEDVRACFGRFAALSAQPAGPRQVRRALHRPQRAGASLELPGTPRLGAGAGALPRARAGASRACGARRLIRSNTA